MKPRVYTVYPLGIPSLYQCDRTVQRFRALAAGRYFLMGEDEDSVWLKCEGSRAVRVVLHVNNTPHLSLSISDNPWCEPLVEVAK